jgi:dipeptidase D
MHALERCRGAIRRIAGLCGAAVEQDQAYPGWLPKPDAKVVRLAQAAIGEVIGRVPELKAIHAGLE